MKVRYTCKSFRPIIVDTVEGSHFDPAREFAVRAARREFGRRGDVSILRLDSWTTDGSCAIYQAFIGERVKGGGFVGRNIWLTVTSAEID